MYASVCKGYGLPACAGICIMLGAFFVGAGSVAAAPVSWDGLGDGVSWHSENNWDPNGVPGVADDVTIASGAVNLTNDATVASLTLDGTNLTFVGWDTVLTATDVILTNGAVITHPVNSDTNGADGWQPDNRVYIVCTNLYVDSGAMIDAMRLGYQVGSNTTDYVGRGPGGGPSKETGGGHGGAGGGDGNPWYYGGVTNGNATTPESPGSGGAYGGYGGSASWGNRCNGGGAVWIGASGKVTVNGTIRANGGSGWRDPGGAGGSIYIACASLAGNGSITADGGNDTDGRGGGGGGGRIAIHTSDGTGYNGSLSARGGWGQWEYGQPWSPYPTDISAYGYAYWGRHEPSEGGLGTIYLQDGRTLKENRFIGGGGHFIINGSSWSSSGGLVISNFNACFEFTSTPATLSVNGDITLIGGKGTAGKTVTRAGRLQLLEGISLSCGNVTISNEVITTASASEYWKYAKVAYLRLGDNNTVVYNNGATLSGNLTMDAGAAYLYAGAELNVAGDIWMTNGATLWLASHGTNGTPPDTITADNFMIATTCVVNANIAGYMRGPVGNDGYGPGGGKHGTTADSAGGGGHGGAGGDGPNSAYGGDTNDVETAPVLPGSGGASGSYNGCHGGGAVRIDANGTVTVDGIITAGGGGTWRGGGGAGGSIYIECREFAGSTGGVLRANGSASSVPASYGGGGGGRIAVYYKSKTFSGTMSAAGYSGTNPGDDGTIYEYLIPPAGAVLIIQ
jgi:hypothetical protein